MFSWFYSIFQAKENKVLPAESLTINEANRYLSLMINAVENIELDHGFINRINIAYNLIKTRVNEAEDEEVFFIGDDIIVLEDAREIMTYLNNLRTVNYIYYDDNPLNSISESDLTYSSDDYTEFSENLDENSLQGLIALAFDSNYNVML